MHLDASNLPALARGCALLGSGGGGDPGLALTMALCAVAEHGPVRLVGLDEMGDDELVMPCGPLGAPAFAEERMWNGGEGEVLRSAVRELHGAPVGVLMCLSAGGAGGVLPVTWAARTGLPLADADGAGRWTGALQRQAMHLAGLPASPVVVTDGRGNTVVVHAVDDAWADRLASTAVAGAGGVCAGAAWCMPAGKAVGAAIGGSLSRALALGAAMEGRDATAAAAALAVLGVRTLLRGRVVHIERWAGEGVLQGAATLQGSGDDASRQLRLELRSAFLLAVEDGDVVAAVPDIISVLERETGEPVTAEQLPYGAEVVAVAIPAPDVWHSPAGLAASGPAAFGLPVGYMPIGGGRVEVRAGG